MAPNGRLLFGEFELRANSGELFRSGIPVKLQPQPAHLLEFLAQRSGEVVTREEIRLHLWGEDTFVDFEHGLNFSIRQIRRALGDSAQAPRFVETIPRRGYRFLPPVQREEPLPAPEPPTVALRPWRVWATLTVLAVFALLAAFFLQAPVPGSPPPGASQQAWDLYIEARYLMRNGTSPADLERGVDVLRRVVLLAPEFADAYAALALVETKILRHPGEQIPLAEAMARQALVLDPRSAEAHLALFRIHFFYRHDLRRAEEESRRSVAADPGLAEAHVALAGALTTLGRHGEAITAARRARALDPEGLVTEPDILCYFLFVARRYDGAVGCGRRVLELGPARPRDGLYARRWIFLAAWKKGDLETALIEAQSLAEALGQRDSFPPPQRLQKLQDFWTWDLERLTALSERQQPPPSEDLMDRALGLIALGEHKPALDLLEKVAARRIFWLLPFMGVDPRFDPLRGNPRFERLLRRS